jgi:hypothetical protein
VLDNPKALAPSGSLFAGTALPILYYALVDYGGGLGIQTDRESILPMTHTFFIALWLVAPGGRPCPNTITQRAQCVLSECVLCVLV